jgi:O-antigen/teichoic acid export membrane protein
VTEAEGSTREPGLSRAAADDVQTVVKGGAVQITGQVIQRSLTFLFQAFAIRYLGTAPYGVYRQITQVLAVGGQLGLGGFNYAGMRFITRARANKEHGGVTGTARVAIAGALVTSAIVFVALLLSADVLAPNFADTPGDEETFARLFRLGAAYVPLFALLQVLRYCTQAYKTMVPSVVAGNVVQPAVRFVLGIGLLVAGFEVAGAVATLVISVAVGAVVAGVYLRRMLTEDERRARAVARVGPMLRFAFPQAGASLLGIQTLGLGILILGLASTDRQVALFGAALSLQGPGNVFLGGIVNIWAPVVSDLHEKGEIDRLGSLYQTINRWIATFSYPVFAALMIEPDLFVRLFAGGEARGAESVVVILAVGNIFYTGTGPTGYVISMTGRPGVNFANSIAAVAAYATLGAVVVPDHGAVGMAVVDAVITALVNIARVVEAKLLVGVQPFGRTFYKPVVATIAGVAVLLPWSLFADDTVWLEVAGLLIAAGVFMAVLRRLGLDAEERHVWERIRTRAGRGRGPSRR